MSWNPAWTDEILATHNRYRAEVNVPPLACNQMKTNLLKIEDIETEWKLLDEFESAVLVGGIAVDQAPGNPLLPSEIGHVTDAGGAVLDGLTWFRTVLSRFVVI